ncbi:MAG: MerR family DNA-binding transcriptional regulator [Betaproteobacteria bacterium]|nr:MAG: MerR family DNA-binding transcriptional regulator [Betaproteobacteria bacterium]
MRVSELAKRTGVSAHRLRRYEDLGLIRAERQRSGYREFAEIAMGRDLGFSLKAIADMLPRYRAGTLTIDEMIVTMRQRIDEVDAAIAEQQALRRKLVSHIGWFKQRERKARSPSPFPSTKKASR